MTEKLMQLDADLAMIKLNFINKINSNLRDYVEYYRCNDGSIYDYEDELEITEQILTVFNNSDITLRHHILINNSNYLTDKINKIYWDTVDSVNKSLSF